MEKKNKDFISDASHAMRMPLAVMKEGVSLLLDEVPGKINEDQKKLLATVKGNIDKLVALLDKLIKEHT